jgi:hypothetical protein
VKIIGFVASLVFFIGGLYLLGLAFALPGFELITFLGGILLTSVGIAIPVHVLKRVDA